jgi:Nucleotidyltransferase of unknown function (DUF6036)
VNDVFQALSTVETLLSELGLAHSVIGGLAVIRWGRPRATQDVDVSAFVELGSEMAVCNSILNGLLPRIDDPVRFAVVNRVLLARTQNGVPVDIGLAAFPFEEDMINRSTPFQFAAGVIAPTISAEDLIVMKCIAGRGQDWADIESVVVRQSPLLDWDLVNMTISGLMELLPESDAIGRLAELRRKLSLEGYE